MFSLRHIITAVLVTISISGFSSGKEKIKVFTSDMPPWSMNGDSGIFMDIIKEISKSLPYEFEVITVPWSRAQNNAKKIDRCLILPISRTFEREKQYQWIKELMLTKIAFISVNGAKYDIESARKLSLVLVHKDTPPHIILKRKEFKNIHSVPVGGGYPAKMLVQNRAEAWFSAVALAKYTFIRNGYEGKLTVGPTVFKFGLYIASINLSEDQIKKIRLSLNIIENKGITEKVIYKYTR